MRSNGKVTRLSIASVDGVTVTDAEAVGAGGVFLKARLKRKPAMLAPGAFDALSALLIEQAGFEAIFISGGAISYTQLARPDIGLISLDQLCAVTRRVRERLSTPLIVDADNGFGDHFNVVHTMRSLEHAGASAVLIDDQAFPKRSGSLAGKTFVAPSTMAEKVRAAVNARRSRHTLVIARTDALPEEGRAAALDRANLYMEAGADALFIDSAVTLADLEAIVNAFPEMPLVINMIEGGSTPALSAGQLSDMGFSLVLASGALVRGFAEMADRLLGVLKRDGATTAFADQMLTFGTLNHRLGLEDLAAQGRRFDPALRLEALIPDGS